MQFLYVRVQLSSFSDYADSLNIMTFQLFLFRAAENSQSAFSKKNGQCRPSWSRLSVTFEIYIPLPCHAVRRVLPTRPGPPPWVRPRDQMTAQKANIALFLNQW